MPPRRVINNVLGLLALLHLYIGWRLIPAIDPGTAGTVALVTLLVLSTLLLPAGLLAPALRRWRYADQLSWVGMLAMGFFSSLFLLTVARDLGLLLVSLFAPASASLVRASAIGVPAIAFAVTLVGLVNARRLAAVRK